MVPEVEVVRVKTPIELVTPSPKEGMVDDHLIETFHPLDEDNFEDDAGFSDINSQISVDNED